VVGTTAGAGPHDRPGAREGSRSLLLLGLSLRRPFLVRLAMFGWAKVALFAPSLALKGLAEDLSEPDRQFLEEEVQRRGGHEIVRRSVRPGRWRGTRPRRRRKSWKIRDGKHEPASSAKRVVGFD
jgi:hypothetical protein